MYWPRITNTSFTHQSNLDDIERQELEEQEAEVIQ
jgi:hypothetical protein